MCDPGTSAAVFLFCSCSSRSAMEDMERFAKRNHLCVRRGRLSILDVVHRHLATPPFLYLFERGSWRSSLGLALGGSGCVAQIGMNHDKVSTIFDHVMARPARLQLLSLMALMVVVDSVCHPGHALRAGSWAWMIAPNLLRYR